MSGITTGVGLMSGMNIAEIVDQLMTVESRPKVRIENRNEVLKAQQESLQELRTKLLSLKGLANGLTLPTAFSKTKGTSSNEGVLGITSRAGAIRGNYSFTVARLVASQQTVTRGFAGTDSIVAPSGATLSFERGEARLDASTSLADLNGGAGVQRGMIRITDRTGASAVVDLSTVATVDDVLERINSASGVNVAAEIDGDRLRLVDLSGGTASNLIVANVGSNGTATSLGIAGSSAASSLSGAAINSVGRETLLSSLNDGNGIGSVAQADFRISAGGNDYDVNLHGATTLGEVIDRINTATGGAVTAAADGARLRLSGAGSFSVTALNSSAAAEDLGIVGASDGSNELLGHRLRGGLNSKLVRHLNGGSGANLGEISLTNRAGVTTQVDLSGAESISEILDRINASGAGVAASLNSAGNGILLADQSGGAGSLTVADVTGTGAADLKLAGTHAGPSVDSGNLQFQYVTQSTSLDRLGVTKGRFVLSDSTGASAVVDLTSAATIGDVIDRINSRGLKVSARINDTGDGITIDDTGPGVVTMRVTEDGSTTAKSLGLLGEAASPGSAIDGTFERKVEIASTDTLADVARKINDAGVGIAASVINDGSASSPFRLSLSARTAGTKGAFVFDDGGLGLGASNLSSAQDAVVFYGSDDPAKSLVITSSTNTLNQVIPGATIDLRSTSREPVQVTISRDDEGMVEGIQAFVDAFNEVSELIDSVDSYNAETRERGLLLGDPAVVLTRQQLFASVLNRSPDLSTQYKSLSQVGITVGRDSKLELDTDKLRKALETDHAAVEALFSFKETETDADGRQQVVKAGVGVRIDQVLGRLSDLADGTVQSRIKAIETQVDANNRQIKNLDQSLAAKRARLETQFYAMEKALAQMQDQSSALNSLSQVAASAQSRK